MRHRGHLHLALTGGLHFRKRSRPKPGAEHRIDHAEITLQRWLQFLPKLKMDRPSRELRDRLIHYDKNVFRIENPPPRYSVLLEPRGS